MTQLNGIDSPEILIRNPSYDDLFSAELSAPENTYEKGMLSHLGAVAVDTGKFTGRSPKDKYIVKSNITEKTIWWSDEGSDNQPISQSTWNQLKQVACEQLNHKKLYIMDGFCGANPKTRLKVRLVTEVAWMAHFFKNMFIRPSPDELKDFEPDWTIYNACKTTLKNYKALGLRSEVFVAFNIDEKMTLIAGTWYGGEIKKGIFSMMNYFLPLQNIGAFHCSANQGKSGDTALFFGLSGTGKTTLSTDPHRLLIGDDEHGWDDEGVFNFEGGCYAKMIDLSLEEEPEIYHALKRNALLENVVLDSNGNIDFSDTSKTQNTRASYPIEHIERIVKPVSKGGHPSKIIFLTCDAFGVLPPVSVLTHDQARFHFLMGYTAKVAGTELGVKTPEATFSACFGQPFLTCHPNKYADILIQKIKEHHCKVYLVNTGWSGGPYGIGQRMPIHDTRAIIDAILNNQIDHAETECEPYFGLHIPTVINDLENNHILNPENTWESKIEYQKAALHLKNLFNQKAGELGIELE